MFFFKIESNFKYKAKKYLKKRQTKCKQTHYVNLNLIVSYQFNEIISFIHANDRSIGKNFQNQKKNVKLLNTKMIIVLPSFVQFIQFSGSFSFDIQENRIQCVFIIILVWFLFFFGCQFIMKCC